DSDVALYYFGGKRSWFSPERGMYLQHGSAYTLPVPPTFFPPGFRVPEPPQRNPKPPLGIFKPCGPALVIVEPNGCLSCMIAVLSSQYLVTVDPNDKVRHCVASCELGKQCGGLSDLAFSVGKEIWDSIENLFGFDKEGWSWDDIKADILGIAAKNMQGSCLCNCRRLVDESDLHPDQ
ncbi:MAG TPA: hypothetical protein PKH07_17925, partial [bacterium]|nr:hypothetical protein [bacterium]